MADNSVLVAKYIQIRDRKAQLKAASDKEVALLDDAMKRIESSLLAHLNDSGADSVGTEAGTFFKATTKSCTVADWDLTLNFIRDNEMWNMLDKRVNKTAVDEYVQANEDLPPGVNMRQETVVRVRRA